MEAVRIASVATGDFLFAFRKLLLKERHHRPVEIAMEGRAGLLIALALLVIGGAVRRQWRKSPGGTAHRTAGAPIPF